MNTVRSLYIRKFDYHQPITITTTTKITTKIRCYYYYHYHYEVTIYYPQPTTTTISITSNDTLCRSSANNVTIGAKNETYYLGITEVHHIHHIKYYIVTYSFNAWLPELLFSMYRHFLRRTYEFHFGAESPAPLLFNVGKSYATKDQEKEKKIIQEQEITVDVFCTVCPPICINA